MASAAHLPPGTVIAGKYELEGLLGEGGMGAVYQATNLAIGRRVAIKILNASMADREDVKRRFELEARAAAVISHPGIVDVLDMGQTDEGEAFIVMEHLEGMTLRSLNKELKGLTPGQSVGVMNFVLEALSAAHRAGVIHRDVKPANIFVCTRPPVVKLLDFGVSRFGESTGLTQTGNAIGTPRYMAPEQVLGEHDLGPEADLYSVGAVLYSLLGGRPPHGGGSDMAMLARILHDTPAPLASVKPGLPPGLCAIVDSLLLKDRTRRPGNAETVRQALLAEVPATDLTELFTAAGEGARAAALSPTPSSSQPRLTPVSRSSPASRSAPVRRNTGEAATRVTRPPRVEPAVQEVPAPRGTSPVVLAAIITVVALVVGAGAGWVVLRKPAGEPVATPRSVTSEPAPAPVVVTLVAEPASARISAGGVDLGCNPCKLSGEVGSRREVRVVATGMGEITRELVFDRERTERVVLVAMPVAAEAAIDAGKAVVAPVVGTKKKKAPKGGLSVDEKNPYE